MAISTLGSTSPPQQDLSALYPAPPDQIAKPPLLPAAPRGRRNLKPRQPAPEIEIYHGDCRAIMPLLAAESVHLVVTDPPYFLDGLDGEWTKGKTGKRGTGSVGGLPIGMKFDPRQGRNLQLFAYEAGKQMLRLLKPGGFAIVFSSPRLSHRMAVGLEDAGFEIRDLLAWHYTRRAQSKAQGVDYHIDRMRMDAKTTREWKRRVAGRKTPQLRPQFEAMILAQKPRAGTFAQNWIEHETGLIDVSAKLNSMAPATVMTVEKPPKRESDEQHLTRKPVRLLRHLVSVFSKSGQTVLDPFLGSGSTAVAAAQEGRICVGIEIHQPYIEEAICKIRTELDDERD